MTGGSGQTKFLADENFDQRIVNGLRRREPTIAIETSAEAGILGFNDPQVLAYAAEHDRILLSHDVRTMPTHFDTFLATGRQSPGLFLLAQDLPLSAAIEAILLVWGASDPDEWSNLRRHLPL